MKAESYSIVRRLILFSSLILSVAGCGSSSPTTDNGTGGLAVKLIWNATGSSSSGKTTAKTLLSAPPGVVTVRVTVSAPDMLYPNSYIQKDFPAADGSGVVDGIPAGPGRVVRVQGLASNGYVMVQGEALSILVLTGEISPPVTINMQPVVAATPPGSSHSAPLFVNLSSSTGKNAIIYYTTNGQDPTGNLSTVEKGARSPIRNILISGSSTILKYFAIYNYSFQPQYRTTTKSEEYSIP